MKKIDYKKIIIPTKPGVYLYYNQKEVIYVGKAKNLKKRTSQYFQSHHRDLKTAALVKDIAKIEFITTDNELDALFLESELIKRYQPRYNILLRDDKSTTYLKISNDDLPKISFTRNPKDDGADYYGPFYNIYPVKQAMRYLRWIFPYLTDNYNNKNRSLLNSHLGLEPKLKTDDDRQKYLADIKKIKLYIRGKRKQIIVNLEKQMNDLANAQEFEQAAVIRNKINQLNSLQNKVTIGQMTSFQNDKSLVELGKLFNLSDPPRRIEGYDISHMSGTNAVASMVVFTNGLADRSNYRRFKIKIDQNDDFYNLNETLSRRSKKKWPLPDLILIDGGKGQLSSAIKALKRTQLGVVPIFGLAKKEELIIVSKEESNIELNQSIIESKRGDVLEEGDFYLINLDNSESIIKLIQRIRDEAHRFAVSYHTKLKRNNQISSQLDQIKGIGPKTKQKLLKKYRNISNIKKADQRQIAKIIGFKKAKIIKQNLK